MRYAGLAQDLEVMGHRALREMAVQGAAGHLAARRQHPHDFKPNRVAQCVEDVGEINVFESRVVEVPHSVGLFDV